MNDQPSGIEYGVTPPEVMASMAGIDFVEQAVASDDPSTRAELLLLSPSFLVPALSHNGIKVWDTLAIAERYGLRYVSCATSPARQGGVVVLGNKGVVPFHDRDLVLNGVGWLRALLDRETAVRYCSIADLAASLT